MGWESSCLCCRLTEKRGHSLTFAKQNSLSHNCVWYNCEKPAWQTQSCLKWQRKASTWQGHTTGEGNKKIPKFRRRSQAQACPPRQNGICWAARWLYLWCKWPGAFVCLPHNPKIVQCPLESVPCLQPKQRYSLKNKSIPNTVLNLIVIEAPKHSWACISLIQKLKVQGINLLMSQ